MSEIPLPLFNKAYKKALDSFEEARDEFNKAYAIALHNSSRDSQNNQLQAKLDIAVKALKEIVANRRTYNGKLCKDEGADIAKQTLTKIEEKQMYIVSEAEIEAAVNAILHRLPTKTLMEWDGKTIVTDIAKAALIAASKVRNNDERNK